MFGRKLKGDNAAEMNGFITSMIGAVLIIVVGILFLPMVQDQVTYLTVTDVDHNASLTGVAASLFGQVPLFYVLGLVFVSVAWIILATKEL